mgnify:CR=1 FL=1
MSRAKENEKFIFYKYIFVVAIEIRPAMCYFYRAIWIISNNF